MIGQEDEAGEVFIIIAGSARATLYAPDGKLVADRGLGPGAIVGEIAAIDGAPRSATVTADAALKALCLDRAAFRSAVDDHPGIAWALLGHFSGQMRRMTERIFEYSTMLARERLLCELLRLADHAAPGAPRAELDPAPSHAELALRISSHREAISREMSRLSSLGLVARNGRALTLGDLGKLRATLAQSQQS
jgi:CRP-like cAMP-binding protein